MPLWNAKLTELLLTARNPSEACGHWAAVLGGELDDHAVVLGSGTRIAVTQGPAEGLAEARFQAGPDLIAAAGELAGGNGTSALRDADGWLLRLTAVDDVAPLERDAVVLSHCTLNSPDPARQRAFYSDLGFLLSDSLGEMFFWMRPNPIHHSMAFARHGEANINHLAVELPGKAEFLEAVDRVVANGLKLEFGPGRHMVGGNLFAYFRDRYGIRWELCAEMGRLDPDAEPGLYTEADRGRSVNTFGPPPPASFISEPGGPPPVR